MLYFVHAIMTPREAFIAALEGRQPPGQVPTFELVFFLTMELLGKVHPTHRRFTQWDQMSQAEQAYQIADAGEVYIAIAQHYSHSAIFIQPIAGQPESVLEMARHIRIKTGDRFFLMCHGDATMSIPNGDTMMELSFRLVDDPDGVKQEYDQLASRRLESAAEVAGSGLLDGFALCADYCFNTGPFLSPAQFAEFVSPFLASLVTGYRNMGYYVIKHTDGNITPILDQLVECNAHELHSLDPQAGIDIAQVKQQYGNRVCLIGNVDCGLIQTGTRDEVVESTRYALRNGMPNGGYIFSTSNCVYTGMQLSRYDLIMDVWKREGNYDSSQSLTR